MIKFKHTNCEITSGPKPEYDGMVDPGCIESVFVAPYTDGYYWLKPKSGPMFSITKGSYEEIVELLKP